MSGFGFLLEQLGIPTITIAKRLHVDPSLVSKWKSGDRRISKKSIFFDEIVEFLIEENDRQGGYILKDPLKKQYPLEDFEDPGKFRYFLQNMIADEKFSTPSNDFIGNKAVREVKAFLYEKGEGRRQAISNLLDMAEAQSDPGNIIYIDCEQYRWLLEDEEYTERWKERILNLLRRGFKAKFIIHFMLHKDEVLRFFELCSPPHLSPKCAVVLPRILRRERVLVFLLHPRTRRLCHGHVDGSTAIEHHGVHRSPFHHAT